MLLMLPAQTKAISLMPEKNKSSTFISKQYKRYLVNAEQNKSNAMLTQV